MRMATIEAGTQPRGTRSYDWIAHHAATRGDKEAMRDLATGRSFTYAEMNDRTSGLATALRDDCAIERGDRVVVLAENDTNFFEVEFACWKLGAVFVPVNWRRAVPEFEFIVGDCGPDVIIHDDGFAETAFTLAAICDNRHRISWGSEPGDAAPYENGIASAEPLAQAEATYHQDILTIMYTSGTTGSPKGAIITQRMTFWNAVNCVEFFRLGEDMINLGDPAALPHRWSQCLRQPGLPFRRHDTRRSHLRPCRRARSADERGDRRHPHDRCTRQLALHEPGAGVRRGVVPDAHRAERRRVAHPGAADRGVGRAGGCRSSRRSA
jgi:hypothetical protein